MHELKEEKFKKKSDLLERERNLDTKNVSHIMELFWEFHFLRKPVQYGLEPFDPQRIEAHSRLTGRFLSTWEYNLIMDLDLIFRAVTLERG